MNRTVTPAELQPLLAAGQITILDVRRQHDFEADRAMLPGALRCDPTQIGVWSGTLTPAQDIVLYCARGGSVSNSVLDTLLDLGLQARYIEGGIVAWKEAGGEVV